MTLLNRPVRQIVTSKFLKMSHHRVTKCHTRVRHNSDRHQKFTLRHITCTCARTTRTGVVAAPPPPPPPPPRTTGAAQRRETRESPITCRETHSANAATAANAATHVYHNDHGRALLTQHPTHARRESTHRRQMTSRGATMTTNYKTKLRTIA